MGRSKNFITVAKIILLLLVNVICAPPESPTDAINTTSIETLSFVVTTSSPQLPVAGASTPSGIFPTVDLKVSTNEPSVKTLEHLPDGSGVAQEVGDLLHVVKYKIEKTSVEQFFELNENDQEFSGYYGYMEVPKSETELIENGEDTEDVWVNLRDNVTDTENVKVVRQTNVMKGARSWLQEEILAVIAALFLLVLVFSCIITIMLRRYYMRQYGKSQILINEEDMCDPNDMKYFSL